MDTVNTTFDEVWNAEWGDENVTTAELASRLAASMTDGWGFIIDFWPQVCLALSIASSIYIVYSTRLSRQEDASLLETLFSVAALCTGLASLIMLSSLKAISEDTFNVVNTTADEGWFCQAQGGGVAYFQLATCFFLAAVSKSVYMFVCLRETKSTIKLTLAEETAQVEVLQQALDEGLVPPSPPSEISVLTFYAYVCFGVPLVLVGGMWAGQVPSATFSFQQMHNTGWCTINANAPLRSFTLFYLPIIACMFYIAGAYYFCFTEVKTKKGLLGKIDYEIMYDASAALVKKKTEAEFDRARRATAVVRLSLFVVSICWTPQCLFGVLLVGSSHGVVGTDPQSLLWLSKIRAITAILNPTFGLALFMVIESCFNFRLRYSQACHQKLRRLRYKCCGKSKSSKKHSALEYDRTDDDVGVLERVAKGIQNAVWQTLELIAFAPWALVVWVPMDTFRTEVKSNKKLSYISIVYLVFIALPSAMMFVTLPSFYSVVDATLLANDVADGDPKQKFSAGAVGLYVLYLVLVVFIAWLHVGHKGMTSCSEVGHEMAFYGAVAVLPIAGMGLAFDYVWEFIEDAEKSESDAISIKHAISISFVYVYISVMFIVVAGTLYISRDKTELNYIADPVSHAGFNTQNLRKLISQVWQAVQLTSLLLSHDAFSSEEAVLLGDDPGPTFNRSVPTYNESDVLASAGDLAAAAADEAQARAQLALAAVSADDFAVDFAVMRIFMFDLSYFKALFTAFADMAFDIKLGLSMVAVGVWVIIVMVPIVLDTITLANSDLFVKIYTKIDFVQELLAGPLFLIILQSFMATVDCARNADGQMVLELKPSQVCWETNHLLYASIGLTGMMAFVPLAALTMVEHENEAMHFRYTPLYYRIEIVVKALMVLVTQFSNSMSPMYSFPFLLVMSAWMILANQAMMPCCILWANRLKTLGFMCQFWTAISGMIAYYWWESEILLLGGVPLTPVSVMVVGWFCIFCNQIQKMRADRMMLLKPKKHQDEASAWSDYFATSTTSRDKLQISKLNSLRLAKRPDDTKIRYNTHHEILVMIYILRAEASAETKQRALQILSAATGSTSAEAHTIVDQKLSKNIEKVGVNDVVEVDDNVSGDDANQDSSEPDTELTISVQTRRRLLGFQGDEHDEDEEDYHFPEVVLVSPRSIISLLAEEFHLTRERDKSSAQKYNEMWTIQQEPDDELTEDDSSEQKKKKEEKKKEKKKEMTKEEREEEKRVKAAEKLKQKEQKEAEKTAKKEEKKLKKEGLLNDDRLTDVPLKTAEILFLLKRAKSLISPEVVESFGKELPKTFVVNTLLSYIRHYPPDVLRLQVSGAGATTMGVDKSGRPEFHDDHLLEHILELPEDRIYGGTDQSEEESLRKIRMIRRMYSSSHVHKLLLGIETLPDETLNRTTDAFDAQLDGIDLSTADESDRQHHELLRRIHRLEQEKQIIDNEINAEKDEAMSNVAKVYLMRIFAIYAEDKSFAKRIVEEIGPQPLIDYLMHGDQQLQAAATVCIYQLARFDPDCLDTLEHTPGGMVYVATKLTHPEKHTVVMHRIAADLLVELAKRFELRRSMVASGLIGPLLLLVDHYAQLLSPGQNQVGERLRKKIDDAVVTFTPRHVQLDKTGAMVNKEAHVFKKGDKVLVDTNEIEPWCPFSLKGTLHHATHMLLSVLRVFQQLSDEDKFRSEFVGRHKGLQWIKEKIYTIQTDDAKVMAMRLLLGIVVNPFGLSDILQDGKMFEYYLEMMKFKEDDDQWEVELEPILKSDEWTPVEESAQKALRAAHEAGTKSLSVEMRGHDFDVDMEKFSRVLPSTGRLQRMRIRPMIMQSRDMVLRMRMHRVAQFLDLKHRNESKQLPKGQKHRLVVIEKMSFEETARHNMSHDASLLEVVRERVLEECFDIIAEASMSTDDAVRIAGVTVLASVCSTVMHLDEPIYEQILEHMHKVRKRCIEANEPVMYESVVESMVALCRNHRKGQIIDRVHTAAEVFELLWMYKHMLGKDLDTTVQSPFWKRVAPVLTPEVLQIVSEVPNTSVMHQQAYENFVKHRDVEAFFTRKEIEKRDARRAQEDEALEGHYYVNLKPATRDKIERGVRKAIDFAHKLATHKKKNKSERKRARKADKQYDKLLSRQLAHKDKATEEHDDVIKFLDNQLDAEIQQESDTKAVTGRDGAIEGSAEIKFGNPLAALDGETMDGEKSPDRIIVAAQTADDNDNVENKFEDKRKQAKLAKKEKRGAAKTSKRGKKASKRKSKKGQPKSFDAEPDQADSEDENGDFDFSGTLPPFLRLVVEAPSKTAELDSQAAELELSFAGEYQQDEMFNGCPRYVHSVTRTLRTPLGDMQSQTNVYLSVIRGSSTDRWFLCSDADRLDNEEAHEAFLTTPKGQLPIGAFQWRTAGIMDEVTIVLKALVSLLSSSPPHREVSNFANAILLTHIAPYMQATSAGADAALVEF